MEIILLALKKDLRELTDHRSTISKRMGISALQLQGTKSCQDPKWPWKMTVNIRWACSWLTPSFRPGKTLSWGPSCPVPELLTHRNWDNQYVLFSVSKFVVICYTAIEVTIRGHTEHHSDILWANVQMSLNLRETTSPPPIRGEVTTVTGAVIMLVHGQFSL